MGAAGNIIIGGLITGAIYALLAVGYSLVFSVSGALNLAQGAFVALGALTMYTFTHSAHFPIVAAFAASLVIVAAAIGVIEWVVIRPAVTRISHANLLMMMGGLLTAFEGAAFLIWGSNPFSVSPFSGSKPVRVGALSIPTQGFWVIGAMLAAVIGLSWLLARSRWGRGLRATSENMTAARLMGVPVDRMILLSFVAAAALGVIAGTVISPLTSLDYSSMASYTNEGLIAVSLGGLGTVYGSVAGGLALGVIEAVVSGYVSSLFSTAISLIILIAIIFLRPQGLLGRVRGARIDVAERTNGRIYAPPSLSRNWARVGGAAVALIMIFVPEIIPAGDMRALNITGIFCLTIVGLDLLTGIAGQVSLGQAGFMAIGGYLSAILAVKYQIPTLAGLVVGMAGSALVAVVLGLVCGRLRGMYLAITTLAFGILIEGLANGLSITGGPSGIGGIPAFSVAGFAFDTDTRFFYLIWALVAVALIGVANFVRSNRGRILRAMHGDQAGARSLGLNITRAKISVFVISACLASIAGSLYASYFRYLSPDQVGSSESLQLITMLVIGGMGTLFGPLIGVALLTYLPLESQSIANYSMLLTGVLLVLFLRYLPAGIWGGVLEVINRLVPGKKAVAVTHAGTGPPEAVEVAEAVEVGGAAGVAGASGAVPALDVRELNKTFGGVRAVRSVSFTVPAGSLTALIGPNGAGKSTVFNLVTNLYRPDSGEVVLAGQPITGVPPDRITSLGLFRTFQTARVFPQLSVLDNVLVGGYRLGRAGYLAQALRLPKSRREERELTERAQHLLEVMGLADRAGERAAVLPMAAQKYLELARSLMARPSVVLYDEPGAGLNDAETAELGMILRAIRDTGHTVLVVEHNMSLVMGVCDHVVVMDAGRVIAAGPPSEVSRDPVVIGAYFGAAEASA
ncbi:MAG TPA: ATP-binding cassette domain-containing protein [Streptosporangiaceae bacterium]|jgi:branched-chain amino acid transport system permease protein|nr:ATP-binding cassette domain-containing protein [Streptosporangiaceae bacterium]